MNPSRARGATSPLFLFVVLTTACLQSQQATPSPRHDGAVAVRSDRPSSAANRDANRERHRPEQLALDTVER